MVNCFFFHESRRGNLIQHTITSNFAQREGFNMSIEYLGMVPGTSFVIGKYSRNPALIIIL